MDDTLWDRLPDQLRDEVDRLIGINHLVQAAVLIRESADPPTPTLRTCAESVMRRKADLGTPLP